jgi:hypothetical protein
LHKQFCASDYVSFWLHMHSTCLLNVSHNMRDHRTLSSYYEAGIIMLIFIVHSTGIGLYIWIAAINGPIVHSQMICVSLESHGRMILIEKAIKLGEKPVPVLLCPPLCTLSVVQALRTQRVHES